MSTGCYLEHKTARRPQLNITENINDTYNMSNDNITRGNKLVFAILKTNYRIVYLE